jgi:hypothetical protein
VFFLSPSCPSTFSRVLGANQLPLCTEKGRSLYFQVWRGFKCEKGGRKAVAQQSQFHPNITSMGL